jgi:hypothetical protein
MKKGVYGVLQRIPLYGPGATHDKSTLRNVRRIAMNISCFLCGEKLEIRQSKKLKPYFICDKCGLQAFIRKEPGINKLIEIAGDKDGEIKLSGEISGLISHLEKLRDQEKEIQGKKGFLGLNSNEDLEIAEKAIKGQIRNIQNKLKRGSRVRK